MAGRSLIRAAEIRSVNTEYQRWATASHAFRDKYLGLPGDLSNATSFWDIAGGTTGHDTTCAATASTNARTCNGNGDGLIADITGSQENLRFWQHLANAGMIEGQYNGVTGSGPVGRVNVPAAKFDGAVWVNGAAMSTCSTGTTNEFAACYGNWLRFRTYTSTMPITPGEAWNIDTKSDDGQPATGRVLGYKGDATNTCTDRANQPVAPVADAAAVYNLANDNKICRVLFVRVI